MTAQQKLEAIQALLDGQWDNEQLKKVGHLWSGATSFKLNVQEILDYPTVEG